MEAIVEQKAASPEQLAIKLVNPGIYCFRADLLWKHIGELRTDNPAHEYYLTDMVEILNKAGHSVAAFEVPDAGELLGINTRVELAAVDKIFRDRKVRELMLDGVTIERPETVTIDADVRIGEDSIVEPFARILGRSTIGADCKIGAGSILENSVLGDAVQIAPLTSIADSRVDTGAHIGPFARLRNGQSHRRKRAYRKLRRAQEYPVWSRRQGESSGLSGRLRRSANKSISGQAPLPAITTE